MAEMGSSVIFVTPLLRISKFVTSLPFFGLTIAVLWSLLFDFERSTATHCHVANFLPSVSAAIALTPQAYVWRICIALHAAPRYIMTCLYWIWHSKQSVDETKLLFPLKKYLVALLCLGNFLEVSGLLGLSFISSRESHFIHIMCFVLFIVGELVCMILTCVLNSIHNKDSNEDKRNASLKFKVVLINITSFVSFVYLFFRHNSYCEPGVYTLAALCEYVVIVTNMAFHYLVAYDFPDHAFLFCDSNTGKIM